MTDEERAWLILSRANITAVELDKLLSSYGSILNITSGNRVELERSGLAEGKCARIAKPEEAALKRDAAWLVHPDHHLVTRSDASYPDLLRQIPDPPILIYLRGSPASLALPALAIVGSRNPTRGGLANAEAFASELSNGGFCIVSGLAQGIDTAAHRGALDGGSPTVAVLGHGMDRVYPRQNAQLLDKIGADGAVITEYPLGTPPRRANFPQRNRLISGLSIGTLVVEAARRSGSLITARLAAEQGREVFAIPGSIHNPMSRGCHLLIQQGVKLVEEAVDIVCELGSLSCHLMQNGQQNTSGDNFEDILDNDYKSLIDTVGYDPITVDEIAQNSSLTIEQVSSMLLLLELEGWIEQHSGGRYARTRSNSRK